MPQKIFEKLILMLSILVMLALFGTSADASTETLSQLPVTGLATYYNPGIMERAAYLQSLNHGFDLDPDAIGYVAMLEVRDMGRIICITANGITIGPLQVADVAGRDVRERLREKGWVVDIDWPQWETLGLPRRPRTVTLHECVTEMRIPVRKKRKHEPI